MTNIFKTLSKWWHGPICTIKYSEENYRFMVETNNGKYLCPKLYDWSTDQYVRKYCLYNTFEEADKVAKEYVKAVKDIKYKKSIRKEYYDE